MATWTAEKRRKLPRSQMGDPDHMAFPVEDQEDLDNAARLIGRSPNPAKVKSRLIAIAKRLGLKLPESWREDVEKMSADDQTSNNMSCFDVDFSTFSVVD